MKWLVIGGQNEGNEKQAWKAEESRCLNIEHCNNRVGSLPAPGLSGRTARICLPGIDLG